MSTQIPVGDGEKPANNNTGRVVVGLQVVHVLATALGEFIVPEDHARRVGDTANSWEIR